MVLITQNELHSLFDKQLGESIWVYSLKHLQNVYRKKSPTSFVQLKALNLSSIISLFEKRIKKPVYQPRYANARWRVEYDNIMEVLRNERARLSN